MKNKEYIDKIHQKCKYYYWRQTKKLISEYIFKWIFEYACEHIVFGGYYFITELVYNLLKFLQVENNGFL